jgi:predicted transcriptional regulator
MPTTARYPITIGVRVTEAQARTLRRLAAADDRPPSSLARRLLTDALEQQTLKNTEVFVER